MENKLDARIIRTRANIENAFIELCEIKGYKNVSVSDITKKANLNRNTFYLHYQDKEDLIHKMILRKSEEINEKLNIQNNLYKFKTGQLSETLFRWVFSRLAMMLKPDMELFRVVLLDNSLNGYMENLSKVIKDHLAILLNIKNPRSNLVYEYTFNGMIGIIKQWIIYSPASDADTAKILAKLAYNNLLQFNEIN